MTIIEHTPGTDMFKSGANILVCPVNLVPGVMGRGLALEFAKRWPHLRDSHVRCINNGSLRIDKPAFVGIRQQVLFIATKRHWRNASNLQDLESALVGLRSALAQLEPHLTNRLPWSIAIPALGCGLGGLEWADVKPLILAAVEGLPLVVHLYPPHDS